MDQVAVDANLVTVWAMRVDGISPESLACWGNILGAHEIAHAEGSYAVEERRNSFAAYALLRCLLEAITGHRASDWALTRARSGKLEPASAPDRPAPYCSLTHTDGLVACAASVLSPIGIDAELRLRNVSAAVITTVLASSEIALLEALPAAQRSDAFLRLWTLREAYVKAAGRGLHFPSEKFSFELDPPRIRFHDGSLASGPAEWQFCDWSTEQHILSVALRCSQRRPMTVVNRSVTPAELTFALSRESEPMPAQPCGRDAAETQCRQHRTLA